MRRGLSNHQESSRGTRGDAPGAAKWAPFGLNLVWVEPIVIPAGAWRPVATPIVKHVFEKLFGTGFIIRNKHDSAIGVSTHSK